ncbi:beta-phosphoglucomutase family hydrolase [Catenovulum sp. 2E275]|uniref:HAD family hydrolase n=1 Tax=Catenovulum sp. 2E275 TaxID=2980497 RepID=UPI0021D0F57E|nr:beta-phosphoglucomutase family hydrolase [Catenovulum sp. 2E275]MCU4674341.1 beta-phosphoglucomutase family hydrolase [Catenovulum sp. 2E275]
MYTEFDAIIFDMDGTLVDSGRLHQNAWTEALNKFAIPINPELMRSLAGVPTKETVDILVKHYDLNINATSDEVNDFKEAIVRETIHQYVKPTKLAEFARENLGKRPMSVGTGAYTGEAKQILEVCGLSHLIDHLVGADQVKNPKPAPDTFLRCAELMNMRPEQCIVFEDAKAGIQAAKSAGMFVVDVLEMLNIENDYFLSE